MIECHLCIPEKIKAKKPIDSPCICKSTKKEVSE